MCCLQVTRGVLFGFVFLWSGVSTASKWPVLTALSSGLVKYQLHQGHNEGRAVLASRVLN